MNEGLITTLLGILIASVLSQTMAVWIKINNLEKKITASKCPFGTCPVFERAKIEAAPGRGESLESKLGG